VVFLILQTILPLIRLGPAVPYKTRVTKHAYYINCL
jgi:hypothetical protein